MSRGSRSPALLGIDTGGTFTDFLLVSGGRVEIYKLPSTPEEPARAVLAGLDEARRRLGREPDAIVHGFTVATNALLTRSGARVAFVTTKGFEDLLAIGRQARPSLYALVPEAVPPLVARGAAIGVEERIGPDGRTETALAPEVALRAARVVASRKPEAVAVCLLHSYARPAHEKRLARALRRALPGGTPVSLSSEVSREYREFERASTATVNAYLAPVVRRYLERVGRAAGPRLRIMQSNGGAAPVRAVRERPVLCVLSGPAGGVLGAARLGERVGLPGVLTLDVGGTSTDVAVAGETLRTTKESTVGGLPIRAPMLEVHTVGAGGGSLARVDRAGALSVGPESAGADPGPACYGKSERPTVTDAQLVLGRIVPERFAGGAIALDVEASWRALARLGRDLGPGAKRDPRALARRAAQGVIAVANANMERALRVVSVARGHDPRGLALVAFGGAGGLHAAELGTSLGVREVVVPPAAGVLSAWGLLGADEVHPLTRTVLRPLERAGRRDLDRVFGDLEREARARWGPGLRFRRSADLRYVGQSWEIEVPWGREPEAAFHRAHGVRYGYARPEQAIEVVNANLEASRPGPRLPAPRFARKPRPRPSGRVSLDGGGGVLRAGVYEREDLGRDAGLRGPALVVEYGATTYLPPGRRLRVDEYGNLRISVPRHGTAR